jgi:hypothetical protein
MEKFKNLRNAAFIAGAIALESCCCLTLNKSDEQLFTTTSQLRHIGKKDFCHYENLEIVSYDRGNLGRHESNIRLYTPNGTVINNFARMSESGWHKKPYMPASNLANFGGYGEYKAQWLVDGDVANSISFNIHKCSRPVIRSNPTKKKRPSRKKGKK